MVLYTGHYDVWHLCIYIDFDTSHTCVFGMTKKENRKGSGQLGMS
jgi:hypothetical protein